MAVNRQLATIVFLDIVGYAKMMANDEVETMRIVEEYTRKFEDVLSLQDEIAGKKADELHAALSIKEREQLDRPPTTSPEAYDRQLWAEDKNHMMPFKR